MTATFRALVFFCTIIGCGSSPQTRATLAQAMEAAWGIDTEALGCVRVELDAPTFGNEILQCECPDRPACEAVINHVDEVTGSYTAGRGERPWSSRFTRGTARLDVIGDPLVSIEMSRESGAELP